VSLAASAGAAAFAVFGSLLFGSLATLFFWIPPRGNAMLWLARRWSRWLLRSSGVRVEARYEAVLDRGRSYVFIANHQSYFDIPALLPTIPVEVRFAAKRSLFHIPVFGWALWAGGFIPIDRENRSRAQKAFAAAAARLKRGVSVLFFPEGSRSFDGRLATFERGAFLLALRLGLPIVPVGVSGAHRVQPRGRLAVSPGTITVTYGAPIEVAGYGVRRKAELIAAVQRRVAELAGTVIAGGGGEGDPG
jgi:1-acyl-sn-glycerol-3-phosphate acyltransferase